MFFLSIVPIENVYVMTGDRIELVCDVTSSPTFQHVDGHFNSAAVSSLSYLSGLTGYSRHHQTAVHHRRRSRRYNRHSTVGPAARGADFDSFHPSESVMDDGYLVLWFVDPDRKPFYRYIFFYFICLFNHSLSSMSGWWNQSFSYNWHIRTWHFSN